MVHAEQRNKGNKEAGGSLAGDLALVICSRNRVPITVPKFITRFQIRLIDTHFLH